MGLELKVLGTHLAVIVVGENLPRHFSVRLAVAVRPGYST